MLILSEYSIYISRGHTTVDPGGPKNGRSKICPFLYYNGHTEVKILKKNYLAKTHQEGPKIDLAKIFFFDDQKNT